MRNKRLISLVGLCVVLPAIAVQAAGRDPFQPASWTNSRETKQNAADNTQAFLHPLEASPLNAYRVIGTMTAKSLVTAVIKSPDGKDHFVKTGDALGNEGGHIKVINSEGISVDTGGSLVTVPVSNKIEVVPNDKSN